MQEILNNLDTFQELLKDEKTDIMDLFRSFGILSDQVKSLNKPIISQNIDEIAALLEALYDGDPKQKLFIALKIGTITNEIKKSQKPDTSLNAIAAGSAAVVGARMLMGAGPLGMLAAGVLGVAGGLLLAKENDQRPLDNVSVLTIAYYLSMYDHHSLFGEGISAIKAFEALGSVLNIKHNTLKSRRDCFDSIIPKEQRVNKNRDSTLCKNTQTNIEEYKKIINTYKTYDEEHMREVIEGLLETYQNKEIKNR